MPGDEGREIFFEIVTIGASAKVSAIDSVTGTEVSIIAPAGGDEASLKSAALRKLEYVLKKNSAASSD
jgi:hypothetical protein